MLGWLVVTFVLAQVVAGVWFDYVQPRVRFAHLYRQFDRLDGQVDVLCLGSSRFGTCLNDAEMTALLQKRVINLGVPLGDLVASENSLDQALLRGLRPRLVLLEISPEFVSGNNSWLEYHLERHLRWDHLPRIWRDVWEQGRLGYWLEERLLPWYVHRKGYWNAWGDLAQQVRKTWSNTKNTSSARRAWEQTLELDARTRLPVDHSRTQAVIDTFRYNFQPYRPGEGATARALDRLLSRCRRENIKVVLVAPPLRSDHRRLYTRDIENAFEAYVKRLRDRYQVNFLDGRVALKDEQFLDNQHADAGGSQTFTTVLCGQPVLQAQLRMWE